MATLEEAQKCPKCKEAGEIRIDRKVAAGRLLSIYCNNERCSWYNTPWNVSVRADGTIPDPQERKGPKQYIGFEGHNALAAQLREAIELDKLSQEPGAEIRRRR